jgi:hypothetical protein
MVRARSREFYRDLAGLVNVEMIHSSVPSHDIVRAPRCRGVLVLSSTVGFEAALAGRAVVMLGPADFAGLPAVHRVASLDEAIDRLRRLCLGELPSEVRSPESDRANLAYLCAVLENACSLDYMESWVSGAGQIDVRGLVAAIHERLGEPVS